MAVEAVLVLLLLITPGIIGDALYRFFLRRPDPEQSIQITRALLLSAMGLVLALFLADVWSEVIPAPMYLAADWWATSWTTDFQSVAAVAYPWLVHSGATVVVAGAGILLMRRKFVGTFIQHVTGQSLHRNAWDEFAQANHRKWVFLKLVDGRHYYGELGIVSADRSRDLVLWHPYPYDEKRNVYERSGAFGLFVPGEQVASILVAQPPDTVAKMRPSFGVYSLTGEKIDDRQE
jgi:hypothetical protein